MRRGPWLFVGCYAASGAAALIYEVAWTRLFTLELGHTVTASSTVLAAFMGGLAVGAWLAGRFPPRPERRLQAYAALEIFIALLAIALPVIFRDFRPALAWAYADGNAPARFAFVRVALSLVLLGLPAAAMGATFPIAAAWLADVRDRRTPRAHLQPAIDAGLLYAANTAGAAAGAVGAGFWLLPALGLRGTTWTGVGLNTAAAFGALWLAREPGIVTVGASSSPQAAARDSAGRNRQTSRKHAQRLAQAPLLTAAPRPALACAAAALSGFSALVYEVAWTRLLALVIGPTTYAFATMAAAFISGIALGSAAGARLARRASQPALWLAGMLVIGATSASVAAWFAASRLPILLAYRVARSTGLGSVLPQEVLSVVLLLLPTSFALGAAFTLALATASSGLAAVGRDTARVYVANTLGAVAGALAAGFVLVPRLGLQGTVVAMSRVGTIAGVVVATTVLAQRAKGNGRPRGLIAALATGGALITVLVNVPGWDRELLASGAYKYARTMSTEELEASLRAGKLEYYKEGAAATVSVRRLGGSRALAIDGKVDASNVVDMLTQRMLGLLPVLLHANPQDMLVIGLGSGVTLGSALASGEVRHADVLEISPEVVEASAFFSSENGDALHAPGVRLVVGDGRSHLLLTTHQYDVIVSEPSNPWMAGVAALFTREFFEAARARLKPDGLLCQWAHTYEISASDLESIVGTFASVFPQGTMWLVGDGDLLLIGTTGADIESRLPGITTRSRIGSIPAALADVGISSSAAAFVLLSQFVGGPAELAAYSGGAALQTDDRMSLEFTAVRAMYTRSASDNATMIRALGSDGQLPRIVSSLLNAADAQSWTARGKAGLRAEAYAMAYESFRRAVALDSRAADALRGASEAAAGAHRLADVQSWLEGLVAEEPANVPARVELSHLLAAAGDAVKAIAAATEARRLEPDNPRPVEELASIFADLGDANQLGPIAEELLARFPTRDEARYYHAASLFLRGRGAEAADEARRLLASNPQYAKAQNLLGAACATIGQFECARIAFEASIALAPRDPSPYLNLGFFYLQRANPTAAASYFAEALALDQASAMAREGLAQTRSALATR
jgi:spermidine synthase